MNFCIMDYNEIKMSNAKELFDNAEFYRAISVNEALNVAFGKFLLLSQKVIIDDPIIKNLLKNRGYKEDAFRLPWRESKDYSLLEINLTNLQNRPAGFGPVIAAIDVTKNCLLFDEFVVVESVEFCIVRAFKYYDQYYTLEEYTQRPL